MAFSTVAVEGDMDFTGSFNTDLNFTLELSPDPTQSPRRIVVTNKANKDEFGQFLRLNTSEDISTAVVTLELAPANSATISKTVTDGVLIPNIDISITDAVDFAANQYIEYTVEDGLFSVQGTWRVRLTARWTAPDKFLKTDWEKFQVNP